VRQSPSRLWITQCALALAVLATAPAHAQSPLTFVFTSTVDMAQVGGQPDAPVVVTYTFDPALAPGSGPFGSGPYFASYGPSELTIEIGGERQTFSGPGTGITVFNDAGTTIVDDSYDVRVEFPFGQSHPFLGQNLLSFRFLLVDSDRAMFSSTALPTTPALAGSVDTAYVDIMLQNEFGMTTLLSTGGRPFTLTAPTPPAPKCASGVTTLDELRTGVAGLTTSGTTKLALVASLRVARLALNAGNYEEARLGLRAFVDLLVGRSNLDPRNPDSIPLAQANTLVCGGANVLIGVPLQ